MRRLFKIKLFIPECLSLICGGNSKIIQAVTVDERCSKSMRNSATVLDYRLSTLFKLVGLRIGRPGFDPRPGRCVVSLSKRHLLPKSTGNTQE